MHKKQTMKKLPTILKNFHKTLIISGLIAFLSLSNFNDLSTPKVLMFYGADKLVHFIMYFSLSLVFMLECHYNSIFKLNHSKLILINLLPLFMSISFELLQEYFTTSRTGSYYDEIFNIVGIVTAIFAFYVTKNWKFVRVVMSFPFKAS